MSGPARAVAALGQTVIRAARTAFSALGGMSLLLGQATSTTAKGLFVPGHGVRRRALTAQMVRVGVRAIPIVILIQMAKFIKLRKHLQ